LALIGLAAGVFSALFGVGGGVVIVPLLLLRGRFQERPAMATSLAAIGITAAAGVATYAVHGDVEVGPGLLIGMPAAVGAVVGASLQQRVPTRRLSLLFALLILAVAVRLAV
jgi:uncharacterized membrane protein YfcA